MDKPIWNPFSLLKIEKKIINFRIQNLFNYHIRAFKNSIRYQFLRFPGQIKNKKS